MRRREREREREREGEIHESDVEAGSCMFAG